MVFEHFALNVPDARAAADWYVAHLGLRIARSREDAPYTKFLADETGRVVIEVYSNPAAACHDFARDHPLLFHWAFVARDADAEQARLEKAGATLAVIEDLPDGSRLIMMRDPWGIPLQLCQRAVPMP
jgi:catechol 2,3-dioxygenase-like lactoylglutathione lyase family enzyme